jgi:predicted nucleotidyltransferase
MATLNALFDQFLSNINPDEKSVEYAQTAHQRVRQCLEEEDDFKQYVLNTFLYGSYKRHTATGGIKDVDIVVLTNFDPADEENTPQKVLRKLKAALTRCYDDADNPEYQRRSIRVNDSLPDQPDAALTLDVIPAAIKTDEDSPLLVPDCELKEWIYTHPKGHIQHTTSLNSDECSKGRFVPLVKMMKWWWRYQCEVNQPDVERPHPKGFWVECLTGETFDPTRSLWADHFIAVLEQIVEKYSSPKEVPQLSDPGLPGETIMTGMTLTEFKTFLSLTSTSLDKAKQARDEENKLESSKLWRDIFGDQFPLYDEDETEATRKSAHSVSIQDIRHAQKPSWSMPSRRQGKVRIDAYIYKNNSRLAGLNSDGRVIPSGLALKFIAKTNLKGRYEVWWQVVNTGNHARTENGLRGGFFRGRGIDLEPSANPLENWEASHYSGKHWIECFLVKDGVCVARSGRFYVTIRNPDYR